MEGNGKKTNEELMQELIDAVNNVRVEQGMTNARLDQTNARLDQTNARLDQTNARLDQNNAKLDQTNAKLDEVHIKLGQTNAELAKTREDLGTRIDMVKDELITLRVATSSNIELLARADAKHQRVDDDLRDRVERIEQHLGLQPEP